MSSMMFYCLKVLISAIFENWVTDGWTDGPTDGRTDGQMGGHTDGQTYGKSPHSLGLPCFSPRKQRKSSMQKQVEQAKRTADH